MAQYDALLFLSFGGPEGPDDVMPFLENVLRGRNVPRERMLEVAEHYQHFGGVSPINAQNRALIEAIRAELAVRGIPLPVYWGNRNWHPFLAETLRTMRAEGVRRALAFVTSAYSCYSSCRQYLEDIAGAREEVGPNAPEIDKLRQFFNHAGFVEPLAENVRLALEQIPAERRGQTEVLLTAHSIPLGMARTCAYEAQLQDVAQSISRLLAHDRCRLVYQSRSGPPTQPWLEPDVADYIRTRQAAGQLREVVIAPIGFISDHMEVLFDLDTEARALCAELGVTMVRAATVGTHPRFVGLICDLVEERMGRRSAPAVCGSLPLAPDVCPADCCPSGRPAPRG